MKGYADGTAVPTMTTVGRTPPDKNDAMSQYDVWTDERFNNMNER